MHRGKKLMVGIKSRSAVNKLLITYKLLNYHVYVINLH